MSILKYQLCAALLAVVFISCKKEDKPAEINPIGFFQGTVTVIGSAPTQDALLVRENGTARDYYSSSGTDTSAMFKREMNWARTGDNLKITQSMGMGYQFDCTLKAPTDSLVGMVYILSLGMRQNVGFFKMKRIN